MLSKIVSKTLSVLKTSLVGATVASYVYSLLKPFLALLDIELVSFDSVTKCVPLVNGATTTSGTLIGKFKNRDCFRSFANKVVFCVLTVCCNPLSVFTKNRHELVSAAVMFFFLVLDLLFVIFCLYMSMRTLCPKFAESMGLGDMTVVSNIKEIKGIRQCYLYLKQQLFLVRA